MEYIDVPVSSLARGCTYPQVEHPVAASDTCQAHATSAVKIGISWRYRCSTHRGLIKGNKRAKARDISDTLKVLR